VSAFVVPKAHIDALLTAGLWPAWSTYGPLRWFDVEEVDPECFEEGLPWSSIAPRWSDEHRRELTDETAGMVGAMLWAENRRSVNHRYAENDWEDPYIFKALPGEPSAVDVLKALSGYEYQSCEHPGWAVSEAKRFCEALRGRAIRWLPGYESSDAWAIKDRSIFVSAK
jgi:hypothetical protein